ncbi:UPF0149 family protein [Fontimonas sp. SYSU GA230001]|uniref:UPF0149 family protein n=1 Tax=Fontimonas sp. SYSU GA230001 TaxID=3142450 RepID=UPI0032B54DAD
MTQALDYDALAAVLRQAGLADEAAEYHGALCGALCVREARDIDVLRLIEPAQTATATADARAALEALRAATAEALSDEDMRFSPLLPDDDAALVPRVSALVAWCQGFLYGLASRPGLDLQRCSADLREIVRDFTELTQAAVGDEVDANIEETAYAELVEYLRVGAQLVFMELHPRPTLDPTDSPHLH